MSSTSFTPSPPGLIATPLGLNQDGVITSPAWVAFFTQILFPLLTNVVNAQFSKDELLLFRGAPSVQEPSSDLMLSSFSNVSRETQQGAFPPGTPFAPVIDPLAMLAAVKTGISLPSWVISDAHANRANYPNGAYLIDALFVETDRLLIYRNTGTAWKYVAGTYTDTLANIPTLGTNDAGLLFAVSDYAHLLRWSGTAWGWAPGDPGSGMLAVFEIDPGTGWHLYDGSTVNYLKADGTTGSVVLPDLAGTAAFLEAGTPNSGPTAAVAPTFTGGSFTPAGTVGSSFAGDTDNGIDVQAGAGSTVVGAPYTPSGTVTSTFTGTPGTPTGTISATGEPRKIVRRPWFRQ